MDNLFDDFNKKSLMNKHVAPFFMDGKVKDECILFIHGFTGSPADMRNIAQYLNDDGNGYPVYGVLLPGHGTKMEDMEGCDWKDWVLYVGSKLKTLLEEYEKVNLVGFSMGGNVALCLGAKYKINKIVCIATPVLIKNKLCYIAEILSVFRKYTMWKKRITKDGEIVFDYQTGYKGMPVKSIGQMRNIILATHNRLKRINQPLLIAQPLKDKTVPLKSPYIIYDKVKSDYKEILLLEQSGHNPMIGEEREKLFKAIYTFIKHLP